MTQLLYSLSHFSLSVLILLPPCFPPSFPPSLPSLPFLTFVSLLLSLPSLPSSLPPYSLNQVQELRELSMWSEGHVWSSPEQHGCLTAVFKVGGFGRVM